MAFTVGLADIFQFGHQLAALVAGVQLQIDLAHALAPRLPLGTQPVQPLHAEHRPRPPRLNALANPDLLLLQQLVSAGVSQRFFMQLRFLALLILRKTAGIAGQLAAVQLDNARADTIEERTVMGDEEQGHARLDQHRLQPFDGGDVEVVGRLVEQQHLGCNSERLRQRQPLLLSAGQAANARFRVQAEAGNHPLGLRLVGPGTARLKFVLQCIHARQQGIMVAGPLAQTVRNIVVLRQHRRGFAHAGNHRLKDAHLRIEGRLLRHVTDTNARLHPDLAVVQPPLAGAGGHRCQQRGFTGTVAADQRHPFARVELEIGVIE